MEIGDFLPEFDRELSTSDITSALDYLTGRRSGADTVTDAIRRHDDNNTAVYNRRRIGNSLPDLDDLMKEQESKRQTPTAANIETLNIITENNRGYLACGKPQSSRVYTCTSQGNLSLDSLDRAYGVSGGFRIPEQELQKVQQMLANENQTRVGVQKTSR